ncbi:RNI-like protein [Westerdykella ornata]|uniref:RNI-like protein n=1 Tax=Westerdykella ornata TaxID=318751 RepID=A0A6A6JRC2_WESOR|nr:RNI-like protein [Westerdykella ornata]KAF2278814.1 RNI-like protein [Westerdykella ornata]
MEDIHGVDVSWLHHSTRATEQHRSQPPARSPPTQPVEHATSHNPPPAAAREEHKEPSTAPPVQEAYLPSPPPVVTPPSQKVSLKRPPLLSRGSSEKTNGISSQTEPKPTSRRNSWISSISSKFSSSQTSPAQTTHAQAQGSHAALSSGTASTSANGALSGIQSANGGAHATPDHYVPQPPKGSFLSNALRRLSSGPQVTAPQKGWPQGGICPRRVMNVDTNRTRCLVPELDQNKLRRVAFCVDVEIAGGPRYKDDVDEQERKKRLRDKKIKEKGEGEALKHPDVLAQEKDHDGAIIVNNKHGREVVGTADAPNPEGTVVEEDKKEMTKKKEKKKRSEAERKERKEKKRRKAEENGSIPLELTRDDGAEGPDGATPGSNTTPPKRQSGPTTDPLRIYRRCCQLRETPVLKRISDQLANPKIVSVVTPGVVTCLDLSGSRLQLHDIVTLSDWLAVVPVKKLLLEDADLDDERVRVILAGLLAAKVPGSPTRKHPSQDPGAKNGQDVIEERSGVVLKLVLKNNPKIGVEGWKHISLFLYMCKSIQAIDVSMIPFPNASPTSPAQGTPTGQDSSPSRHRPTGAVADIFSKAISERLGGSRLEELVMAECSLTATSIRKIIEGVIVSGVQRLGLATNDIDDEGLDHVIHYIKSGVCQGLDLGGNALRDKIGRLAESVTEKCPLWALSLADCDLTPDSLKILFPALVNLPAFRFLDLSHNKDLFAHQTSLCLLRKYIPQLKELKRIHLMDVSLSPEGTIGLAEVLPECSHLAHVNILENPAITAVATATDEPTQEEAAALYASLMVAAKLSRTLICIDVDVPGPGSSEVVKALAKQVVAFCLRNMETFSEIPELSAGAKPTPKEVEYPHILRNLVLDGIKDPDDAPTADDDYIVGSTGVVKALNYCLLQKATDLRRASVPASGTQTPRSSAEATGLAKAKEMSKDLLEGARNIRARLQPALVREARAGNDMGYRRLLFLDQTLQGMIQRFEDEYPETRLPAMDASSAHSSLNSSSPPTSSINPLPPTPTIPDSSITTTALESDDDEPKALRSRHNSDVSLASRALSLEEGRLHRLGHRVRTELLNASRPTSAHSDHANVSGTMDDHDLPEHLLALRNKYLGYSGEELRVMTESVGWERAFDKIVENAAELKSMMHENPEEFRRFRETQIAALRNRNPDVDVGGGGGGGGGGDRGEAARKEGEVVGVVEVGVGGGE